MKGGKFKTLTSYIDLVICILNRNEEKTASLLKSALGVLSYFVLHYAPMTSMVGRPCMDPILDLNDVISNNHEPPFYWSIQANLHPVSIYLRLLM